MTFSRNYRRSLERRVTLASVEKAQRRLETAEKLQVFRDGESAKLVLKMFNTYISDNDISDLPEFLRQLDALFVKFKNGNNEPAEEEGEEVEEEETITEEDIPDPEGEEAPPVTKKVVKKVVKKEVEAPEEPVYDSSLARYIAASLIAG